MRNCLVGVLALLTLTVSAAEDLSKQHARSAPEWLRNGVVYEIFPRNFSPEGNFNGITARLDELKSLGVDILWLMPIHPYRNHSCIWSGFTRLLLEGQTTQIYPL